MFGRHAQDGRTSAMAGKTGRQVGGRGGHGGEPARGDVQVASPVPRGGLLAHVVHGSRVDEQHRAAFHIERVRADGEPCGTVEHAIDLVMVMRVQSQPRLNGSPGAHDIEGVMLHGADEHVRWGVHADSSSFAQPQTVTGHHRIVCDLSEAFRPTVSWSERWCWRGGDRRCNAV